MVDKEDYRERIGLHYSRLGKRKKILADRILSNPLDVVGMSISKLAELCGCDQTTIVRFAQQIGYTGYPELKLAIARKSDVLWKQMEAHGSQEQTEYETICENIVRLHEDSLRGTLRQIPEAVVLEAAGKINAAAEVMICGAGTSALAAEDLSVKLTRLGVRTLFYRDQEMWKSLIGTLKQNDVLIVFSNFGETPPFAELLKMASGKGIVRIGVTSVPDSTVGKNADLVLHTNNGGELPIRLGAMASRTSQMAAGDLLTMAYSRIDKERSWKRLEETYVSYTK